MANIARNSGFHKKKTEKSASGHHERDPLPHQDRLPMENAPEGLPPHDTVYYYFHKWKYEGVSEDVMDTLREKLRCSLGRDESPSDAAT